MTVFELTEGCYDPSVYPLVELWGFAAGEFLPGTPPEGGIPSQDEIDAALALVGFDRAFSLDPNALTVTKLIEGAKLDLGGIAKGYAAQLALMVRFDICNVGGNISVGKEKAVIGVPAPRETETGSASWLFSFNADYGACISTSGDYERYYIVDGVRYHHIIDTHTGYPASSGTASVTVVSKDGAFADAFATAAIVGGADKADDWRWLANNRYEGIEDFALMSVSDENEVSAHGTITITYSV